MTKSEYQTEVNALYEQIADRLKKATAHAKAAHECEASAKALTDKLLDLRGAWLREMFNPEQDGALHELKNHFMDALLERKP